MLNTENYQDAAVTAVNLGEDTDTVAAITGSITGILYGSDSIPAEWLNVLVRTDELVDLAKRYDEAIRRQIHS